MQLKEALPLPCEVNLAAIELQLNEVAEIAWKFVTQPNPPIVAQPEMYYGEELQERYYGKWNDDCEEYTLVYARPLVYRSYHGKVMSTALVGKKAMTTL